MFVFNTNEIDCFRVFISRFFLREMTSCALLNQHRYQPRRRKKKLTRRCQWNSSERNEIDADGIFLFLISSYRPREKIGDVYRME